MSNPLEVPQRSFLSASTALWLLAVVCLLAGFMYWPWLISVSLVISSLLILQTIMRDRGKFSFWSLLLPAVAVFGLVRSSTDPEFGSAAHAAEVSALYGWIVWYAVCGIALASLFSLILLTSKLDRQSIRTGGLNAITACLFFMTAITISLIATGFFEVSRFHLLWTTPTILIVTGLFTFWLMRDGTEELEDVESGDS